MSPGAKTIPFVKRKGWANTKNIRNIPGIANKGALPSTANVTKKFSEQYKGITGKNPTIKEMRSIAKKQGVPRQVAGLHSFPGIINKGNKNFPEGQAGRFTQSIKGQPGKKFLEKAIAKATAEFTWGKE